MGLAGEEGAHSERDVLRGCPGAQQADLPDCVVTGRHPVHEPRLAPARKQVGGRLRGEAQLFADLARGQMSLSSGELVIQELEGTIRQDDLDTTRNT